MIRFRAATGVWGLCLAVVILGGCNDSEAPEPETWEYTGGFLDQNWDRETQIEWWFTSQGSRVIPYDWYLALERPDSEELVRSTSNMERLRFIPWPPDPKWNPDGLAIGFVKDTDGESGEAHFGFTCAACHTGLVTYEGKQVLVDGGPAHSDFDGFLAEIGESLQQTLDDSDKFARFADRVLGDSAESASVTALKERLAQRTASLAERLKVNKPPHPAGYARLDAFGNIFNEGSVFAINEPSNAKPANAPVSYPVLWDTPQHDVVQWNGAAVNAGTGPYNRNVGEVVGVFGDLRIEKVAGSPTLSYQHHIDITGLERLEEILVTLWSPQWPEDSLPPIDRDQAALGKVSYDKQCRSCHADIDRADPNRKIKAIMVPIATVGTDPTMATNIITSVASTGILEGQGPQPFGPREPTASVVGFGVIGVLGKERPAKLQEGSPAYLAAVAANKPVPPRYKARPLNGIWASAPFLHNGSVPNIWELLKKPEDRVTSFHVGSWEMDPVNVGFVTDAGPATSEFVTSDKGNSNSGHDYGTDLTDAEKRQLVEYIKTL
jgi:mono/diheme cytochrome c family protein